MLPEGEPRQNLQGPSTGVRASAILVYDSKLPGRQADYCAPRRQRQAGKCSVQGENCAPSGNKYLRASVISRLRMGGCPLAASRRRWASPAVQVADN